MTEKNDAGKNKSTFLYALAGTAVVLGGVFGYARYKEKRETDASSALATAVADENGRIGDPEKDGENNRDPRPVFKTAADMRESALGKYRTVQKEHPQTGAAILARLGEALLDRLPQEPYPPVRRAIFSAAIALHADLRSLENALAFEVRRREPLPQWGALVRQSLASTRKDWGWLGLERWDRGNILSDGTCRFGERTESLSAILFLDGRGAFGTPDPGEDLQLWNVPCPDAPALAP
jgi:hypothetical protein